MKKIILLLALCLTAITTSAQRLLGGDISVLPNYEKDGTVYQTAVAERYSSWTSSRPKADGMPSVSVFCAPRERS